MTYYRLEAKIVKRSEGHSSVAAAAYRAGVKLEDERTGITHDYSLRQRSVRESKILAPDDAPAWVYDRSELWNTVERVERYKTAQVTREVIISLPRELPEAARMPTVCNFIQHEFVDRGMVADINLHNDKASDGGENPHVHVLLTMRTLDGDKFAKSKAKARAWNALFSGGTEKESDGFTNSHGKGNGWVKSTVGLQYFRAKAAQYINQSLTDEGSSDRCDHRSYKDQGIEKEPQPRISKQGFHNRNQPGEQHDYRRVQEIKKRNSIKRGVALNATGKPSKDYENLRHRRQVMALRRARMQQAGNTPPKARSRNYDGLLAEIYGQDQSYDNDR